MANVIKQPCEAGVIGPREAKSPCAPNFGRRPKVGLERNR
jgi:hypothetical protein